MGWAGTHRAVASHSRAFACPLSPWLIESGRHDALRISPPFAVDLIVCGAMLCLLFQCRRATRTCASVGLTVQVCREMKSSGYWCQTVLAHLAHVSRPLAGSLFVRTRVLY